MYDIFEPCNDAKSANAVDQRIEVVGGQLATVVNSIFATITERLTQTAITLAPLIKLAKSRVTKRCKANERLLQSIKETLETAVLSRTTENAIRINQVIADIERAQADGVASAQAVVNPVESQLVVDTLNAGQGTTVAPVTAGQVSTAATPSAFMVGAGGDDGGAAAPVVTDGTTAGALPIKPATTAGRPAAQVVLPVNPANVPMLADKLRDALSETEIAALVMRLTPVSALPLDAVPHTTTVPYEADARLDFLPDSPLPVLSFD